MSFLYRRSGRLVLAALCLVEAVTVLGPPAAMSQDANGGGTSRSYAAVAPRGSRERAAQLDAFIERWGAFVQQAYGTDIETWRGRLAGAFLAADGANVAEALTQPSFSGAMAALHGLGHRVSARADVTAEAAVPRLGDVGVDLVYTPVVPCRIVDTRSPANPLAANGTRSFQAIMADYSAQGGEAGGCGLATQRPGAVVLNVTMVAPDRAGYATVYPFGATQPLSSSVNYAAGAIVNNSIVTPIPDPAAASDFTVYSFGAAHVVIDIVGYYDTPEATPLTCVNATSSGSVAARSTGSFAVPACPAGTTRVSPICQPDLTDPLLVELLSSASTTCDVNNRTFGTLSVTVGARCCRVPGR